MDIITRDDIESLIEPREGFCISIFMPTFRAGPETLQHAIRFKNLVKQAEQQTAAVGFTPAESREILRPLDGLQEEFVFWQSQGDGLALFLGKDFFRFFRLPLHFQESVTVNDRFFVKPLLSLFSVDGRFYILTLSGVKPRLFQATALSIEEVELKDMPDGMENALRFDDPERELQFHTHTAPPGAGERPAMYYGTGAGADVPDRKNALLRYFQIVDKGLKDVLGNERVPLILAAVDYLAPIYREAGSYPNLLDSVISGNPDGHSASRLHELAWPIAKDHFLKGLRGATEMFREKVGEGKASKDLQEILSASLDGRNHTLFVPVGLQQWGTFQKDNRRVSLRGQPEAGDEDLLNLAAVQTLRTGGDVYAVEPEEIPDHALVAAVFRY